VLWHAVATAIACFIFVLVFGGYDMFLALFLAHGVFTFSAPLFPPVGGLCSANRSVFEASDPHEFEEKSGDLIYY
jgi:hypothetical protein